MPVALIVAAAGLFIARAEDYGPDVGRNLVPLGVLLGLWTLALVRNRGAWLGSNRRWSLAALGYAVPALGLSLYLHAQWYYDVDGLASSALSPGLLFTFLPYYTGIAGVIGFAIGWIVGKNVSPELRRRSGTTRDGTLQ